MRNFTKEEVNLCRQIAEKDRKEIKEGDYVKYDYGKPKILLASKCCINTHLKFTNEKHYIPLWTIEDCLEFLREKGWIGKLSFVKNKANCRIYLPLNGHIWSEGKTPLEALLKAGLVVLEKK